ncbi:conserved hypothetical protein [Mycobacterium tuberculosis T17]|nr:conserved hypothetical protein [Mycobacterium tuberculosis T17]
MLCCLGGRQAHHRSSRWLESRWRGTTIRHQQRARRAVIGCRILTASIRARRPEPSRPARLPPWSSKQLAANEPVVLPAPTRALSAGFSGSATAHVVRTANSSTALGRESAICLLLICTLRRVIRINCNVIAYTGAMMYFVSPILRIEQG